MKKITRLLFLLYLLTILNSCQSWLEFDLKRIKYIFFFTLLIGFLGYINHSVNNKNDKK